MLAVRQEIKSVVTAGDVDTLSFVVRRRELQKHHLEQIRKGVERLTIEEGATGRGDGYAVMVKGQQETREITLNVGRVQLDGVVIDSGASCNLIDYGTWNSLKEKCIRCESKVVDKKLFAYGH